MIQKVWLLIPPLATTVAIAYTILSIPVTVVLQIFVQEIVLPWPHHLEEAPDEASEEPGERAA